MEKCDTWFRSLSINEQKRYTAIHPYYGKMDSLFVMQVKHGIKELYDYLVTNKIIGKEID